MFSSNYNIDPSHVFTAKTNKTKQQQKTTFYITLAWWKQFNAGNYKKKCSHTNTSYTRWIFWHTLYIAHRCCFSKIKVLSHKCNRMWKGSNHGFVDYQLSFAGGQIVYTRMVWTYGISSHENVFLFFLFYIILDFSWWYLVQPAYLCISVITCCACFKLKKNNKNWVNVSCQRVYIRQRLYISIESRRHTQFLMIFYSTLPITNIDFE